MARLRERPNLYLKRGRVSLTGGGTGMEQAVGSLNGPGDRYVVGLDPIRLIAAVLVMTFHLSWKVAGWSGLTSFGWVGVEVFFVISGFVISQSVIGKTPLSFLRSRILRLYPAAWGCLLLSAGAILLFGPASLRVGVEPSLTGWSLLGSSVLAKGPFVASAYWTLPVEISFYALVGLALTFAPQLTRTGISRGLIVWSGLYFALLAAHAAGLPGAPNLGFESGLLNATLLRNGVFFGVGMILAKTDKTSGADRIWLGLGVALGLTEIVWRAHYIAGGFAAPIQPLLLGAAAGATWLLALAAIAGAARLNRLEIDARWSRALRFVGLITYPLYLLHETIGGGVEGWLVGHGVPYPLAFTAAVVGSALGAAVIVLVWEPRVRSLVKNAFDRIAALTAGRRKLKLVAGTD